MSDEAIPEPDRIEGAPHPRDTQRLFGQDAAEAAFLEAFATGRLHHGWLVTGPRGVGKATLVWRIARFLLAGEPAGSAGLFGAPPSPATLDIGADHPVARRVAALSESRLCLIRRGWDDKASRLKTQITVDEVRRLAGFFGLSSADGGRRVVIVDAADDMNTSAANALLKLLEEPPKGATLLLVSHQPSRLLPTIRSRCRELRCSPLGADDMGRALAATGLEAPGDATALAELSAGSVGEAVRLVQADGLALYSEIVGLFAALPRLDRPRALALAERAAGRGAEDQFDLILTLIERLLARAARSGATGRTPPEAAAEEAALFARIAQGPGAARAWAGLLQEVSARARQGRAVNIDATALLFDLAMAIEDTARKLAA